MRGRRAFVAEKITIPQPDDFAGTEKGQGVQGFAESGNGGQRVAAVGNGGLDGFVVQAAKFLGPLKINLPGALLDGEFVVAANERERRS